MRQAETRIWVGELTLLCIVALAGWAYHVQRPLAERQPGPPFHGTVTGKEWSPSTEFTVIVGDVILPQWTPETFYIVVSGRRFSVSQAEFDRVQIRDEWTERR